MNTRMTHQKWGPIVEEGVMDGLEESGDFNVYGLLGRGGGEASNHNLSGINCLTSPHGGHWCQTGLTLWYLLLSGSSPRQEKITSGYYN